MNRTHNRLHDMLRPVTFELGYTKHAEGSCLIRLGDTHVLCTASIEDKVPPFLRGTGSGWVTAEYGMLPRATHTRTDREATKGRPSGRTVEIQRLIGRSLRAVVDLRALGELQVKIDCDVLQADGGTRTASISGAYLALYQALHQRGLHHKALKDSVAAISCGIVEGHSLLDLEYTEDSQAYVDANFVMTGSGQWVEIQCTAEHKTFDHDLFQSLATLARQGLQRIQVQQAEVLTRLDSR